MAVPQVLGKRRLGTRHSRAAAWQLPSVDKSSNCMQILTSSLARLVIALFRQLLKTCLSALLYFLLPQYKHEYTSIKNTKTYCKNIIILSSLSVGSRHFIHCLRSYPSNRLCRPIGLRDVKDPTSTRQM
jgi:hypothetical protein